MILCQVMTSEDRWAGAVGNGMLLVQTIVHASATGLCKTHIRIRHPCQEARWLSCLHQQLEVSTAALLMAGPYLLR